MLTNNQYERLTPLAPLIHLAANTGSVASTQAWEVMCQVNAELGHPPVNGHCPSCAISLYGTMSRLIKEYENK